VRGVLLLGRVSVAGGSASAGCCGALHCERCASFLDEFRSRVLQQDAIVDCAHLTMNCSDTQLVTCQCSSKN
jgi:hypothetical protein